MSTSNLYERNSCHRQCRHHPPPEGHKMSDHLHRWSIQLYPLPRSWFWCDCFQSIFVLIWSWWWLGVRTKTLVKVIREQHFIILCSTYLPTYIHTYIPTYRWDIFSYLDVDENDKKISIAQSTRLARFCADLIIREEWQFGRMSVGIF